MSKAKPVFILSLLIPLFANLISPLSSFSQTQTETEETLTITTYYPAPFGVYNEMRAKKIGIGDNYYQAGSYPIAGDTDLIVEGNVGIGTASPNQKLDVAGGLQIGNTNSCTNGTIRYTGSDFEGCKTGTWASLTSGGTAGGTLPFYGTAHTKEQCQAAGGTVTDYQSNSFCKISANSCPSGWARYQNLGATIFSSCNGDSCDNCGGSLCCPGTTCKTSSHNFANIPTETCNYGSAGADCAWPPGWCYPPGSGGGAICSAAIIEVGCY